MKTRYRFGRCLLSERLLEAGKIQQDIVEQLGYTKQLVSKWARNKQNMDGESLVNVALYLNCHPNDLYELIPCEVD